MDRAGAAGKVWLVGAGPGSADLVTLRALRVLRQADVWLVDDLVGKALLRYARRGTRLEFCGKRGATPARHDRRTSTRGCSPMYAPGDAWCG